MALRMMPRKKLVQGQAIEFHVPCFLRPRARKGIAARADKLEKAGADKRVLSARPEAASS